MPSRAAGLAFAHRLLETHSGMGRTILFYKEITAQISGLRLIILGAFFAAAASAQTAPPAPAVASNAQTPSNSAPDGPLAQIVLTATHIAQSSFDLPVSVDSVSERRIHEGELQVNMSESLDEVPGVSIQSRQNYAQDLQLSVRGFGARSSFGVRGVRLYSDGIPGTMPDGQGQFSHFDLGSADRIEVLRGPFSALYGNSSGGVISIFTEDAPPGQRVDATAEYGSFNTQRYALKEMLGHPGGVNLVVDASHFATDGYRGHSEAKRNVFNAKAAWQLDDSSKLTLIANAVDL